MTRRSLFSLLPAPLAGPLGGLLTTRAEPPDAPDSDPVAEAALAVREELRALEYVPVWCDRVRKRPDRLLSLADLDGMEREQTAYQSGRVAAAESALRERLDGARGLSVVIDGRVYTAAGRGRPLPVEPRWVALFVPAEGGAR